MLTLGIDDAGRGPVIGPMVLAGCLLDEETEKELKKLGVKDSKDLTQKRREILAKIIKEKAKAFEIVVIFPEEIDGNGASRTKLNELEAIAASRIINQINRGFGNIRVLIDCPSTSLVKWRNYLLTKVEELSNLEISCEHKADKNHVSVSAASILAKDIREKEMDKLKEKYGSEIGSGYTSDPLTIKFLEKNILKYEKDGIFRKTWETFRRVKRDMGQKRLF